MIPCDWDDLDNSAKYRAATKHWWDGWVPFSKRCIPGGMVYGLVRDYHADWITHQKYPNGLVQTITATGWGYQSKLRFLRKAQFLKFQTDQTELILRGWQAAKSEADCNARHMMKPLEYLAYRGIIREGEL